MSDFDYAPSENEALLLDYRQMETVASTSYNSRGGANGRASVNRRVSSDEELLDTMIVGGNLERSTGFANKELDNRIHGKYYCYMYSFHPYPAGTKSN